jgi:predicted nucleotidyltransferase
VALRLRLPPDVDARLAGLGQAIAASSADILFAYLFGSAATGTLSPRSDIDVAIFVAPRADCHAVRLAVARAASRQLATDAVDVVLLNTAPLSLSGRVIGTRQVILDQDPHARHAYESLTLRKFHDFRIREHRILAARGARG